LPVTLRHFENKARRSFWLVHIEAWLRSGVTRTEYCRQHRLTKGTLDRWLGHLAGEDAARKQLEYLAELRRQQRLEAREKLHKKRARRRYAVSTDMRNRAVQAFWAMHVEAMTWSGMAVRDYAAALFLSPTSLRKWRDRLDDGEVDVDWRAHLHPAAVRSLALVLEIHPAKTGLDGGANCRSAADRDACADTSPMRRRRPSRWKPRSLVPPSRVLPAGTGSSPGSCFAGACVSGWPIRRVQGLRLWCWRTARK
jgi:hypothetical protein